MRRVRMEVIMARKKSGISRREFLRRGTAAGLGLAISPSLSGLGWAASKDRVTVLHGTGVDSLHPYNHSSGSLYGLWEHVMEPLVHYDYNQKKWQGRLAPTTPANRLPTIPVLGQQEIEFTQSRRFCRTDKSLPPLCMLFVFLCVVCSHPLRGSRSMGVA